VNNCDSIIVTNLIIRPEIKDTSFILICSGGTHLLPGGTTVNASGIYHDTLISNLGCDSIIITNLTVILSIPTPINRSICQGDSLMLQSGQYINQAGIYSDTLTNILGCDSIVQTTINLFPKPFPKFIIGDSCLNQQTMFYDGSGINAGNIANWEWNFGDGTIVNGLQNPIHQYTNSGSYDVTLIIESDQGCKDSLTQSISLVEGPDINYQLDTLFGCPPLCVNHIAEETSGLSVNWEWHINNQVFNQDSVNYCYEETGIYSPLLIAQNSSGCIDTVQFETVNVWEIPEAGFNTNLNQTTLYNPHIVLSDIAINATDWHYDFGDGEISIDQNPQHIYNDTGSFEIIQTVTSMNGCIDKDTLIIVVAPEFMVYIPNAITLDDNGINEYFYPKGIGISKDNYDLYIFDRWGETIFHSTELDHWWNGTYQSTGLKVKQDVYIYKCSLQDVFGKTHILDGHVTVVR
jgi:gliding motility-associated-like protein